MLWDNAGIARLDGEHNYTITAETHNSPSNLEAYGGGLTGIVGVYRDPLGTGLGSKLVAGPGASAWVPATTGRAAPALHPRRLLDGVIEGVKDGRQQVRHPHRLRPPALRPPLPGKCLVFVGAVGVMPREVAGRPSHQKKTSPGELVVMCGGRVGADGIHGVTASSAVYSEATPAGHVQIGDPYTQKKMHDLLLEARHRGLIQFITDNGGGGLSSSVGESARFSPGAEVDLARVPLKYQGLDPWQIWISESQERMTVAIRPEDEAAFMGLAEKHAVEATVIGRFTGHGRLILRHGPKVCGAVDVRFLEKGFPQWEFSAQWLPPEARGLAEPVLKEPADLGGLYLELLASPNLCCRSWINRQFDHEVQGTSVVKPLLGRRQEVPSEAAVILPVLEGRVGLAITSVLLTEYGDIDTYAMVAASVEEGLRRLVAVGGDPGEVGGVDNFCWPSIQYDPVANPDGRYKAAQLVRACWALRDACLALGIPLLSGKDSMYVDGMIPDRQGLVRRVSGPPTMMFTATAPVKDLARVQTLEPKAVGDLVYLLGETRDELGGSALYNHLGQVGRNVPATDFEQSLELCRRVAELLGRGLLASVCVVGRGGLAHALGRMALAGGLGLGLELDPAPAAMGLGGLKLLFSESTGRYLVTVDPARQREFEAGLGALPHARLGRVTRERRLVVGLGGERRLDLSLARLRQAYLARFGKLL